MKFPIQTKEKSAKPVLKSFAPKLLRPRSKKSKDVYGRKDARVRSTTTKSFCSRCCDQSHKQKFEEVMVPLTGAAAFVKIEDFVAEVTIKQRYENKEKNPVEAVVFINI